MPAVSKFPKRAVIKVGRNLQGQTVYTLRCGHTQKTNRVRTHGVEKMLRCKECPPVEDDEL